MFSGIVSSQGTILKIQPSAKSIRLTVKLLKSLGKIQIGDSIAVNGCCLTVVKKQGSILSFDVLKESWRLTTLQFSRVGEKVNLEASLRAGDRIGGHFVSGHVDGVGEVVEWRRNGKDVFMGIAAPASIKGMLAKKGSISIDGVSLTIASVQGRKFGVWLIPHTMKITTLGCKKKKDRVNLEADILAKYLQHMIGQL